MTTTPRILELEMTIDHVTEALQQYFNRFGWVGNKEFLEVQDFKLDKNGMVFFKGKVLDNG